jgi:hypothetical protein
VHLLASPRAGVQRRAVGLLGTMSRCCHVVESMLRARVPAALVRLLPAAWRQGGEAREVLVEALVKMRKGPEQYWAPAAEELAALEPEHGAAAVEAMARQLGLARALRQHKAQLQGRPREEQEEGEGEGEGEEGEEGGRTKLPMRPLGKMSAALQACAASGGPLLAVGEAGDDGACATCGVLASPLMRLKKCAGCMQSWYCSPSCQRRAWKAHKPACLAAQGEAAK